MVLINPPSSQRCPVRQLTYKLAWPVLVANGELPVALRRFAYFQDTANCYVVAAV